MFRQLQEVMSNKMDTTRCISTLVLTETEHKLTGESKDKAVNHGAKREEAIWACESSEARDVTEEREVYFEQSVAARSRRRLRHEALLFNSQAESHSFMVKIHTTSVLT